MPPRQNPDAPVRNPRPAPPANPTPITPSGPATGGPYNGPPPTGQRGTGTQTPPPVNQNPGDSPALARIRALLDSYGLGSLADWAWQQLIAGRDETQVAQDLRERQEFKDRFAGMETRRQRGLAPMSPEEYVAWERQAAQMMRSYGMPPGFYDHPSDFADLIGKDVSVNELEQRLASYADAAYKAPQQTRDQLRQLYGVDETNIAAFFADPDRGWQTIERQVRAAQVSGAAQSQQFGQLTSAEAEALAAEGLDAEAANRVFGELANSREVTGQLAGESDAGMTREQQLAAAGGSAQALRELEARRRRRQAAFEGGGSFANSEAGLAVGSNLAGT
jgi:hypothetical protein